MWRLDYRECNITKWHRRYYLFKRSVINKIIDLNELKYDDIKCTSLRGCDPIEKCKVFKVVYQECNITSWHTSYFATKSEAESVINFLEKKNYEFILLTEESIVNLLT